MRRHGRRGSPAGHHRLRRRHPATGAVVAGPGRERPRPIQLLGTIDLRGNEKVVEGGDAVVIVRLGGTFLGEGADPPIADPSVTLVEVVPWSEVLAHPDRYAEVLGT